MTHATPEWTADENGEGWEAEGEDGFQEAGGTPATAERFDITDMQHWIDLSA